MPDSLELLASIAEALKEQNRLTAELVELTKRAQAGHPTPPEFGVDYATQFDSSYDYEIRNATRS